MSTKISTLLSTPLVVGIKKVLAKVQAQVGAAEFPPHPPSAAPSFPMPTASAMTPPLAGAGWLLPH